MSFIKNFIGKEPNEVSPNDVENFIKEKVEENLNLDYKHIKTIENHNELAKDVSAFANSAGGLIIEDFDLLLFIHPPVTFNPFFQF